MPAYIFENRSWGERESLSGWHCTSGAVGVGLFELVGTGSSRRWNRRRSRRDRPQARRRGGRPTGWRGCRLWQREPRQRPFVRLLRPVQEQVLRRRVLLQQRLPGNLRDLLAGELARHLHDGRGRRHAERSDAVPERGEDDLRSRRHLRRQGGLPALLPGHGLHARDLSGGRDRRHLRLRRFRRLPRGSDHRLRPLPVQHGHQSMQDDLHC
jgi:hypothetical protein